MNTKTDFLIFCKSFHRDILRVKRFLDSIAQYNHEAIPVVVSVPSSDLVLFKTTLPEYKAEWVCDEMIVEAHPLAKQLNLLQRYQTMPGNLSQQVIKSEAWRLLGCTSYLCADSDTVFLRPFSYSDFFTPAKHPYTILHQSREFLQLATNRGHTKVAHYFQEESLRLKELFERVGPDYDFGPQPLLWSARVWADLEEKWLAPRHWTLWDAIENYPMEIRWYGEALLAFQSIPIHPIDPLFRVYHYDWHYDTLRRLGETPKKVAQHYLGAVYQSNWEVDFDPKGTRSLASRWARRIKRLVRS